MSHAFEKNTSFPRYSFPALENGKPVSLHDYYGEKVVLHVFASW
jgi:alkyl hydroperoxide reductase subunit AhpC